MPRDFQITTDVSRDALAVALCDNPEQLVYVLGEIGANADFSDVCEFHDNIAQDAAAVAQFFRGFADKIDPPTLPAPPLALAQAG